MRVAQQVRECEDRARGQEHVPEANEASMRSHRIERVGSGAGHWKIAPIVRKLAMARRATAIVAAVMKNVRFRNGFLGLFMRSLGARGFVGIRPPIGRG